jgi:hypothetical protein
LAISLPLQLCAIFFYFFTQSHKAGWVKKWIKINIFIGCLFAVTLRSLRLRGYFFSLGGYRFDNTTCKTSRINNYFF